MATIKSYTDLEQSKKLVEILSLETADMYYILMSDGVYNNFPLTGRKTELAYDTDIPCWSLAALLNYLKSKDKFPEIKELSDGRFKLAIYIWDGKDCIQVSIGDSIVDACCELILKLKESNLL